MAEREKRNRRVSFNRLDGSEESLLAEQMSAESRRMMRQKPPEEPPKQDLIRDQVAEDEDAEWRRAGGKTPDPSA